MDILEEIKEAARRANEDQQALMKKMRRGT